MKKRLTILSASLTAAVLGAAGLALHSSSARGAGIVDTIVKAPVAPDGDVTGAPTDLVINLDVSMDPDVPGLTLLQGASIRVTLPEAFVNTEILPVQTPFTAGCLPFPASPTGFHCSTAALLQGWPQHPVGFPPPTIPGKWQVGFESPNTIVITALQDLLPAPPLEPGIKQIHLILLGFINPHPGRYEIGVEAETGPDGELQTGSGVINILPIPRAAIEIAGGFNPGAPNPIYQRTAPNQPVPLNYHLLLWGHGGVPAEGVTIDGGRLRQGERTIGQVSIEAPSGAVGQAIQSLGPSTAILSPILGVPTARLTAQFVAGSLPGDYVVGFHMVEGNKLELFVRAD